MAGDQLAHLVGPDPELGLISEIGPLVDAAADGGPAIVGRDVVAGGFDPQAPDLRARRLGLSSIEQRARRVCG